ncbi:SusF/SusE family outer membrane protein [Bacteroides sp. 51]|uniref:SusF/SusE family outer membrane protein n=1 Tax=Bacteroides sp. 51 TaxID=2302938 RepID=UPI0013D57DD5|nr:SusF/SusE family outer membrane protein [Bacteroides sp. 51]NDV82852.1 SusF/SusE family outer membrane protein [Bacteroides sp. 51]
MRKLYIIPILFLALLGFTACDDDRDENPTYEDPTTFVLNTPAYASTVYDLKYSTSLELTCTQPNYAYTTAVTYTVQVSLTNDFTTEGAYETLETTYTSARMNVDAVQLSKAIVTLWEAGSEEELPADTPLVVYARLKAALTSTGAGVIYSNVIKLDQVLANPEAPVTVDNLYVIGSFNGWDWINSIALPPVHSNPGMFWGIMYFDAGDEFKFNVSALDDENVGGYSDALFSDESIALADLSDNGGNIKVGKAGWYLIIVDGTLTGRAMTYNSVRFLEPIVYLTGDPSGGWDAFDDARKFTVPTDRDGEFVSPAFIADGELRMCVKLEDLDWWKTEFVILNGKIAYRGAGGDQERVNVTIGKKAYLNFMDGTGSVK